MSDVNDDLDIPDDEDDVAEADNVPKKLRSAYDRTKAKNEELARENAMLKRNNVLRDANLGLNDEQNAALLKLTEGQELTPDALREQALKLNWIQPQEDTPKEEQQAHERIAEASAGAQGAATDHLSTIENAQSPEEVMAAVREAGIPIANS